MKLKDLEFEVEKLSLNPGDSLVLHVHRDLTEDEANLVSSQSGEIGRFYNVQVVVLTPGFRLERVVHAQPTPIKGA